MWKGSEICPMSSDWLPHGFSGAKCEHAGSTHCTWKKKGYQGARCSDLGALPRKDGGRDIAFCVFIPGAAITCSGRRGFSHKHLLSPGPGGWSLRFRYGQRWVLPEAGRERPGQSSAPAAGVCWRSMVLLDSQMHTSSLPLSSCGACTSVSKFPLFVRTQSQQIGAHPTLL